MSRIYTERVSIRFKPEEMELLNQAATAASVSVSVLMRIATLDYINNKRGLFNDESNTISTITSAERTNTSQENLFDCY